MQQQFKKYLLSGVIFLVVGILIGLLIPTKQSSCFDHQYNLKPIKIGVILPLTGKASNFGLSSRVGLEIGLGEVNQLKIHGRKIELLYEDSHGEAKQCLSVVNKLINQDKVKIIIGPIMSSATLAVAPMAQKNQVVVMTNASSPDITQAGDYIFRNREKTHQQSEVLADYIYNQLGDEQIAALYVNDPTGLGHFSTFKTFYTGEISIEQFYESGTLDFKTQLLKIKKSKAKTIYLAAKPKDTGLILKQAQSLNLGYQFVATSGSEGKDVLDIAGLAAEGLVYAVPAGDTSRPEVKDFYAKFHIQYPEGIEEMGALVYDSLKILSLAMHSCQDPEHTSCLKDWLYNMKNYHGASGKTTFDQNGDATKTIILKTVRDGQFVEYQAD